MSTLKLTKSLLAVNALVMMMPIFGYAANQCSDLFTIEIYREKVESKLDWNSDLAYISAMQRREKLGQINTFFSKKWDTQVYHSNTGAPNIRGEVPLVDPAAKAVFIFFHGSGTSKSSGANFIANMNTLSNLGYSSISFDMPFHMQGPRDLKFNDSRVFMEWVRSIVLEAKKSGKPVYLAGHSFGPDVALEYVARYPKDVDGVIGLSPAGFTKVLSKWYDKYTSNMVFGGDVAPNIPAGIWAGNMSSQFLWSKGKLADPTVVNPNLKVRILSGNREEYVPAPVGGPNRTPIGENFYDVTGPLKAVLRNAEVTIEPGVGHYLFEAVDKNGHNVVLRELLLGVGERPENVKTMIADVRSENVKLHMSGQLAKKYTQDELFRTWADNTYGPRKVLQMADQGLDVMAKKIMDQYTDAQKVRDTEIFQKILRTKETHPEFYEKYKTLIDNLNPKVTESTLFVPYMNHVLKTAEKSADQ